VKNVLAVLGRKHRPDARALSAYLDRALSPGEASAIEAHVATCAACARELAGLHAVRSLLSSLPQADVPRSFHLRPADVAQPRRQPSLALRLMPALSGAAAIAFAVLLAVSLSGIGEHHTNASSPESARILAAGASSTGTSAEAPAAPGAEAAAPTAGAPAVRVAPGVQIAPTAAGAAEAPAASGAFMPAATPGANDLAAQPAAPATNPDQRPGASTGTSAGTPASTPMTDAANAPAQAVAAPSVTAEGRTPTGGQATASATRSSGSSSGRGWLLWAAIAAAVVAVASGAVSVGMWARRRR
jgi:anti-sigma factor RsiW